MSLEPKISRFCLKDSGKDAAFVQVISFPNSHVWIWVGDQESRLENIIFAIGDKREINPKKNVISTRLKTSSKLEDGIGDGLCQKMSCRLGGKPIFLNWSISNPDPDLIFKLEKTLFAEISQHPDNF